MLGLGTVNGIGTSIDWTIAIPSGIDSVLNKRCFISVLVLSVVVHSRLLRLVSCLPDGAGDYFDHNMRDICLWLLERGLRAPSPTLSPPVAPSQHTYTRCNVNSVKNS